MGWYGTTSHRERDVVPFRIGKLEHTPSSCEIVMPVRGERQAHRACESGESGFAAWINFE